jgi:hypothetical protein
MHLCKNVIGNHLERDLVVKLLLERPVFVLFRLKWPEPQCKEVMPQTTYISIVILLELAQSLTNFLSNRQDRLFSRKS